MLASTAISVTQDMIRKSAIGTGLIIAFLEAAGGSDATTVEELSDCPSSSLDEALDNMQVSDRAASAIEKGRVSKWLRTVFGLAGRQPGVSSWSGPSPPGGPGGPGGPGAAAAPKSDPAQNGRRKRKLSEVLDQMDDGLFVV